MAKELFKPYTPNKTRHKWKNDKCVKCNLERYKIKYGYEYMMPSDSKQPNNKSSMSLVNTTDKMKELAAAADSLESTVKFVFPEGAIYLDGTGEENAVSNDDKDADCTVNMTLEDLYDMLSGNLNPMEAFMGGKMQIDGDMGVAMKLSSILA